MLRPTAAWIAHESVLAKHMKHAASEGTAAIAVAKTMQLHAQWERYDCASGEWVPYGTLDNAKIERAFVAYQDSLTGDAQGTEPEPSEVPTTSAVASSSEPGSSKMEEGDGVAVSPVAVSAWPGDAPPDLDESDVLLPPPKPPHPGKVVVHHVQLDGGRSVMFHRMQEVHMDSNVAVPVNRKPAMACVRFCVVCTCHGCRV